MSGSSIALTVTANDQTAKTIAAINANLARFSGNMQTNMTRVSASTQSAMTAATAGMRRYSEGLNRVGSGLGSMARHGSDAFQKIGQIVPVLGAITGAASLAGMNRMVSTWAEWGLRISNTARGIGVGTKQLTDMQGAAVLAGGSADAMSSGLQTLGQNLYDATGGRNASAIVMLRTLFGQDFKVNAHSALELMPQIADKLASMRDPFARAQVGATLFGGAWQGLEPLLVLGSKRMGELELSARKYNFTTDANIESAKDLALAQLELGQSVGGLQTRISERLAPVLAPMLRHLADWLATSPKIAQAVDWLGHAVERFGTWIQNIDWDLVSRKLDEWGGKFKGVYELLQRFGLVPDLSKVLGGDPAQLPPQLLPSGSPMAAPGQATAPDAPDTRRWYERFYKPGPGLLDGIFGGGTAPNGVPRAGGFGAPGAGYNAPTGPYDGGHGVERNLRNNSPTNLNFANQPGATSDGRFARFPTMEAGVAADLNQFLRYQELWTGFNGTGHRTSIEDMLHTATPKSDNNPGIESYIDRVAAAMHMRRGDTPNLHDPRVASQFIMAIAPNEGGTPDRAAVDRGVALRLGIPAPGAQGAPLTAPAAQGAPMSLNTGGGGNDSGNSKSTVRLEFAGKLPDGVDMRMSNPQKVDVGGPLVVRPLLLGANP